MIKHHDNSVIYREFYSEDNILNFDYLGMNNSETKIIELTENSHGFIPGDAIYYDIKNNHYRRALANNTIMSEVIGVVSKITSKDTFELTLKGSIILDRYKNFQNDSILYLSPVITGKLTNIEPESVSKIIGIAKTNGIYVDIQRGYYLKQTEEPEYEDLRYYTDEEIQNIITQIKTDIY